MYMQQTSENLYDNMPCPECGNQCLIQNVKQTEYVHVNENGDPDYYEPAGGTPCVESLHCPECDKELWTNETAE